MANVEVYLKQDIANLGKAGERVSVKSGYARNFLIPRRLAVVVTKSNLRPLENVVRQVEAVKRRELKDAESIANRISEIECVIFRPSSEEDKIFGSVTARDIAEVLKEKGLEIIDSKKIQLDRPIKSLGIHTIPVKVHPDVYGQLKVWVKKEAEEEPEASE